MRKVLIFLHMYEEHPGHIQDFLVSQHIPFELVQIEEGHPIPNHIADDVAGLVFMGGVMSVNDASLPWVEREIKLIEKAFAQDIPVLGHCLGGQLMSKALGAQITKNKIEEIGWHNVRKENNAHANEWLTNLPEEFIMFHWHNECFNLPSGATRIMTNQHCDNQGYVIGNHLALQCHPEMTVELTRKWADWWQHGPAESTTNKQSAADIVHDLENKVAQMNTVADAMYSRWVKGLKL